MKLLTLELLPELCQVMWLPRVTETILFVTILFYLYKLNGKCPRSLLVQTVKNLPAMQETQVPSLGREDPLEREMATHSVFLPGEFYGQRSLTGYRPWDRKELYITEGLTHATETLVICCLMILTATPQKSFSSRSQQPHLSNGKAGP